MIRDYLNDIETKQFLLLCFIKDLADTYLISWTKRGNITKDEEKFCKYMMTYCDKFYKSVLDRLKNEQARKIINRVREYDFSIIDKAITKDKINRQVEENLKDVTLSRNVFEDFCCEIMDKRCCNCTEHFDTCDLHKMFLDNIVPESGYSLENCRYAYKRVSEKA